MIKQTIKYNQRRFGGLLLLALTGIAGLLVWLLNGADVAVLNPKGLIAKEESGLIIFSVVVMAIIAVPTLFLLYYFAWKYRESNTTATYSPNARHGKLFTAGLWVLPSIFVLILAIFMWSATHRLEPRKSIAATQNEPITIQVVAMRWKWLFIYPDQKIATVNFIQVPEDTPVRFELTADEAPMSSFWIPHWGGQLYAMTGHNNVLHLRADEPGDYPGSTAEINGRGFAGMRFVARAGSMEEFESWVQEVKKSPEILDATSYETLLEPSENNQPKYYSSADSSIYAKVLMKYNSSSGSHTDSSHGDTQH